MGPQPGDQKETRRKQTDERTVLVDDHVERRRDNIRTAFILVKEDCGRRRLRHANAVKDILVGFHAVFSIIPDSPGSPGKWK
jgi:hypothetical protein